MENLAIQLISQQARERLERGEFQPAIDLYEQCLELEPTQIEYYWNLGLAYLLQGDELEAQRIWVSPWVETSAEIFTSGMLDLLNFLQQQADAYLDDHQAEFAEKVDLQMIEIDADRSANYIHLGIALSEQGKYDEALSIWQTAIELDPTAIAAYRQRGEILEKLQNFEEAIACYSHYLEREKESYIFYRLGLCCLQIKDFDRAIESFQNSIQIQQDSATAYSDLGYALLQMNQQTEAMNCWEQALKIDSDFAQTYLQSRNVEGKHEPANTGSILTQLLQQIPGHRSIHQSNANQADQNPQQNDGIENWAEIPQGFYETTWEWAVSYHLEPTHYFPIFGKTQIELKPPKTPNSSIHFSFRFRKSLQLPNSFVTRIPQGQYWLNPSQTRSATLTSDRYLLGDLSPESPILEPGHPDQHPSQHSIFSLEKLPKISQIPGKVAVLSGLLNDVYFHWMFDILPRFELLTRSGINLQDIDYYVIDDRCQFQQESLDLLKIPRSKILNPTQFSHLSATELIVPSFPGHVAWMPKWTCDFLKTLFLPSDNPEYSTELDRIYLSRNRANSRRLLNEDQVLDFLHPWGFRSVTLESMSVQEQALLFSKAKVVIAPHGSGLTNLAFCQPGTKIIEIFSPNYVYHCYWLVSNLVNLEYYYILGKTLPGFYFQKLMYPDERHEDIVIDLKDLKTILDFACIQ